ncbi:MAG: DUF3576 domain-containing protein [Pseudomonadota bacterium]
MRVTRSTPIFAALGALFVVASCSSWNTQGTNPEAITVSGGRESGAAGGVQSGTSLFDAFRGDGAAGVKVNRFLWTASLEVLNFLPITTADPFTGVISTGFGTPPGGGRAYRATVLISDPALDARALNVAIQTRNGPVSTGTQRAVEDAILTRARQLRAQAENF